MLTGYAVYGPSVYPFPIDLYLSNISRAINAERLDWQYIQTDYYNNRLTRVYVFTCNGFVIYVTQDLSKYYLSEQRFSTSNPEPTTKSNRRNQAMSRY